MDNFKIKACNPDNEPELTQLVALFEQSYGERFPFRGAYATEFWNRQAGSRLISLLAVRRHRVLAHLAARPESRDPSVVQICFPACHEDFLDRALEAASRAWEALLRVAERQQWRSIYYAAFSDLELMQHIGTDVLQTTTTAILPGYAPVINPRCVRNGSRNDRDARTHAVIGVRQLGECSHTSPLFVPKRHEEIVTYLRSKTPHDRTAAAQRHVNADAPGIEDSFFKDWGAWHVFVRPSLVKDVSTSLAKLHPSGSRPFVFVDARDPACPELCEALEERGMLFCGLLPRIADTECVVYSRPDDSPVDANAFVCPVAKRLAEYISENEASRLTRVLPQRQVPGRAAYVSTRS